MANPASPLPACLQQIDDAMQRVRRFMIAYEQATGARDHTAALPPGAPTDGLHIGMSLMLEGGVAVPVQPPADREGLLAALHEARGFLSQEIVNGWYDIYQSAAEAKAYCDEATRRAAPAPQP